MAAYVVTPSGELLIYQHANYAERGTLAVELYESTAKKEWIADIPRDWAVGWSRPTLAFSQGSLRDIKRALSNYDSRTGRWKDA